MGQNIFFPPDHAAMHRILQDKADSAVGVILRLAWCEGLTREEIVALRWQDVGSNELQLPGRSVPLSSETAACLRAWRMRCGTDSERVLISERRKVPMRAESVSRLARTALDRAGLARVRLLDLRYDYVLRQIEAHDWPYALRVSGLSVTTYRSCLAKFARPRRGAGDTAQSVQDDAYLIWRILQNDRSSPAGIALWLSSQLGLQNDEIVALTWEQVDFSRGCLRPSGREVAMTNAISRLLQEVQTARTAQDDPHVILTPRTRRPMTAARLSTLVRTALIRGGVENRTLRTLRRDVSAEEEKRRIMAHLSANGHISRSACAELLCITPAAAYTRLQALCGAGLLVHIGAAYYAAGSVIDPAQHSAVIRAYLTENGSAYCQDIAAALHIGKRAAARILKRMAERGEITLLTREKRYTI